MTKTRVALAMSMWLVAVGCGDNHAPELCGNARLDLGEQCDTKIPAGSPGACPTAVTCDDGDPCTTEAVIGSACTTECTHTIITAAMSGDQCCPAGANQTTDADCAPVCGNGVVEAGEACDTAIAAGMLGACPTDCSDGMPCTADVLMGTGCNATCSNTIITTIGAADLCCPTGASSANDPDCPAGCGNGVLDPGENCDTMIAAGQPGACPTAASCNDSNTCTTDSLVSAGTCMDQCMNAPITMPAAGDSCCPPGANANTDPDCAPSCGNGAVESGESCDTTIAAGLPGACPTVAADCNDSNACTVDTLSGSGCGAHCTHVASIGPSATADGCCPAGGDANNDADCLAVCGNGVYEPTAGEACDPGVATGPGTCPTNPATDCNDTNACTADTIAGVGCGATCAHSTISACNTTSDGCCPAGCTGLAGQPNTDADCSANCGDGIVQSNETCDTAIAAGSPGACPTVASCSDGDACTTDSVQSAGTCNASCVNTQKTTSPSGDGCCLPGSNHNVDTDCAPACGNGVVEPPTETCDPAAAPGSGGCPTSCDDGNACTNDTLNNPGTCLASCTNAAFTPCCGDAIVSAPEACDKAIPAGSPGACPAACNDGNSCTTDTLNGMASDCTASCSTSPITPCCGNNVVESGETCEPGIAAGMPGSCANITCNDYSACTTDTVVFFGAPGTGSPPSNACMKICSHTDSSTAGGDMMCCPDQNFMGPAAPPDSDCVCGNGTTNAPEQCDFAGANGTTAAAPCTTSCTLGHVPDLMGGSPIVSTIVGSPCAMNGDCNYPVASTGFPMGTNGTGGMALCGVTGLVPGFTIPDGYCSYLGCDPTTPMTSVLSCPQLNGPGAPNSICRNLQTLNPTFPALNICIELCASNDGCRRMEGYRCITNNGMAPGPTNPGLCLPAPPTF